MSKVTVLLSASEFARLAAFCEEHGFKKSTLIARLIREHLDLHQLPKQELLPLEGNLRPPQVRTRARDGS